MSSFTNTNLDNLLLQTLMGRLQINPPQTPSPLSAQSLEDLLFENYSDESDSESDTQKSQLAREESKLEKEIIRVILSGDVESLKPNSGQAVSIGEHHICVGFTEEDGSSSGYRVWEWHGHVMLFDDDNGYMPEYVYGNYFERVRVQQQQHQRGRENGTERGEEEDKCGSLGLRELIDGGVSNEGRIIHRSSTRF